jgi:Tfp pilus assembly protein PilE
MKMNKGISLIVLVITIIIIIILAGAVILSLSANNPITQASVAKFKSDAQEINSELQLWLSAKYASTGGAFDPLTVNVDNATKTYGGQTISQILTTIKGDNLDKYQILNGQLTYVGKIKEESNSLKEIGISTYLPYVKEGLVLWYDGIDNGGIGVHSSNASTSKNTWVDLSGNGNTMTIADTDFTSTDGWSNNSLILDGTTHTISSNNPLKTQTLSDQSYTVEVIFQKKALGIQRSIAGINSGFNFNHDTTERALIYINSGVNDFYSYSKNPASINTILSYAGTYLKNSTTNTVKLYTNATDIVTNNNDNWPSNVPRIPSGMATTLNYSSNISDYIYAIRIYSRVLTDAEILQNFTLDKARYGI